MTTPARAAFVLPGTTTETLLGDLTVAEWLADGLATAGAPLGPAPEAPPAGSVVVVDGRWPAVSAATWTRLVSAGEGATLVAATGEVVAWVGGPAAMPPPGGPVLRVPDEEDLALRGPEDLDRIERALMDRRLAALATSGVRVIGANRIWIGGRVTVAPGATLWPDLVLKGRTAIAEGAEIRPGCWLEDTVVGAGAVLKPHCVAAGARVGEGCAVGPMAHLREGTVLEKEVKVGNFVEVKKSVLREGSKASHLTYLGDAEVGRDANIGAGTITCNYDGFGKHRTVIGEGAFVGSNSSLVAPVTIGKGAIVGAGSVIAANVPDEALAVERAPLKVLEGKAPTVRERNRRRAAAARGDRG